MKKIVALILALVMITVVFSGCDEEVEITATNTQIAYITNGGSILDLSYDQAVYSGVIEYARSNNITYGYYIPTENTDAAAFNASGLVTESGEEFTVDSVSVSVVEAEEPTQPENPEQPTNPEQPSTENPGETTNNDQNGSETNTDAPLVDENGNVITKLPQTGVNVYTVIAGIAVVAIATVFVVRKIRK